jgi:predicted DNA-binding transcriptional regulator YafY
MDYITYSRRLTQILGRIESQRLESPKQIALSFGVSEKTIRRMINHLRESGYPIEYCRKRKKYLLRSHADK